MERLLTRTDDETGPSLRVALVSETPLKKMNGVTTSVLQTARNLRVRGHEVLPIAPKPSLDTIGGFPVVKTEQFNVFGHNVGVMTPKRMLRIMEDFQPDVIEIASPLSVDLYKLFSQFSIEAPLIKDVHLGLSGHAIRAAKILDIPIVEIFQTDVPRYVPVYGKGRISEENIKKAYDYAVEMERDLHNQATLNLVPSRSSYDDLVKYGVNKETLRLWGRGVDSTLFRSDRRDTPAVQAIRDRLVGDSGKQIVGYVGRLAPEKMVERLAALRGLDVVIGIVGKGKSRKSIEAALGSQAFFFGERKGEQLADAFASFDIYAHTAPNETLGQVIQEASASGLPIVAPRAGGPIDLVLPGENGWLYEPDDVGDLRAKTELLLNNPEMRAQMGQRALELVQPRTWSAKVDELIGHYRDAIELHRAA